MLKINTVANIDSLTWISSLSASQIGSTERVHDSLIPFFSSIGLRFRHFAVSSRREFMAALDVVYKEAKLGSKPILHIDTHGSPTDGIAIAGTNEFISWRDFAEKLRPINIATGNNLCVISGACFGFNAIKPIEINKATPFFIMIAPEHRVSFGLTEERLPRFYEDVFTNNNLLSAFEQHLSPSFRVFHSEQMLSVALSKYVYNHCTGAG